MRTSANPYLNEAGLIQKYIGPAYEHVKAVSDSLALIRFISENMQSIYDFAATKDAFEAFTENPDFLPWLIANQDNLEELSTLLASLVQDYAPKVSPKFTGFSQMGVRAAHTQDVLISGTTPAVGSTNIWPHTVDPSKIIAINAVVHSLHGEVEALTGLGDKVRVWCDDENLRVQVNPNEPDYGNRPFFVTLTIME